MNSTDLNHAMPTALPHDALQRPLSRAEKDALGGAWGAEDLVAALGELFAHSIQNPKAAQSAEQKALLDLAARIQIQEALESHLLDAKNGALPEFDRQTELAVEYFDRQLM